MELLQGDGAGNLREQVVERVRSEIVSGRTPPGSVYSVPGLATELGVSTTPVREALLELARSGLLVAMRNRGFRVERLSLEALDNLFTMRELLERFALETLARQGLKDRNPLVKLADDVAHAVEAGDVPAYVAIDRAFHAAMVGQVGNPLLTKMVLQLRDDMRLYGIDSAEGLKQQKVAVQEHYQMIELAAKGDVQQIGDLISLHILTWKPLFKAALERLA
ncbi:transcriptional regulator, GntR family [Burkholderia sp. YR290]|jgi:DNA-binding GntR family transcriptional regulator|uniref:GntR family transcriptional regulator n=1 Tax=Paraburkholderia hospita TaxID=169430 RepID=UPI0009A5B5A3|nr:GntR family transcriptional regulator [Paraburkholderia hospita]SKC93164.1 transcriptional regulator, GntR family [Paraburkholderia hospita]SOE90379.1 transcriptional regulator, GntR family [Burkholderia sp. YR290]